MKTLKSAAIFAVIALAISASPVLAQEAPMMQPDSMTESAVAPASDAGMTTAKPAKMEKHQTKAKKATHTAKKHHAKKKAVK